MPLCAAVRRGACVFVVLALALSLFAAPAKGLHVERVLPCDLMMNATLPILAELSIYQSDDDIEIGGWRHTLIPLSAFLFRWPLLKTHRAPSACARQCCLHGLAASCGLAGTFSINMKYEFTDSLITDIENQLDIRLALVVDGFAVDILENAEAMPFGVLDAKGITPAVEPRMCPSCHAPVCLLMMDAHRVPSPVVYPVRCHDAAVAELRVCVRTEEPLVFCGSSARHLTTGVL